MARRTRSLSAARLVNCGGSLYDSQPSTQELIVWCAEHGVALSGDQGLAGAVVDDAAVVDLV